MFTVRNLYAEMVAAGTRYAESTVFKTTQRMKRRLRVRPQSNRTEPDGFRVVDEYADPQRPA